MARTMRDMHGWLYRYGTDHYDTVLGIIWYARYNSWKGDLPVHITESVRTKLVGTEPVLTGPRNGVHVQCLTKVSCFDWM